MQKKIVLIGGPGTGKSTVLGELENRNYHCMPEVSREVTLKAQQEGIEQLFLTEPLLFSKMLLEGREQQYLKAIESRFDWVFFDRGIPDIHAYLDYSRETYPSYFHQKSTQYPYDYVFLFKPWKEIYISDNERYESYEQSIKISKILSKAYIDLGYQVVEVPYGTVEDRVNFIVNWLKLYS